MRQHAADEPAAVAEPVLQPVGHRGPDHHNPARVHLGDRARWMSLLLPPDHVRGVVTTAQEAGVHLPLAHLLPLR